LGARGFLALTVGRVLMGGSGQWLAQ